MYGIRTMRVINRHTTRGRRALIKLNKRHEAMRAAARAASCQRERIRKLVAQNYELQRRLADLQLRVKCPRCHAGAGKRCTEPSGRPRNPHSARGLPK